MKLKPTLFALALVAGLALAGCGSDDEGAAAPDATGDAATDVAPATAAVPATALPPPPQLNARSFIVIDHASGRVLAALQPDSRQEPASLTKLMTAYVVFHSLKEGRIKLGDLVTVSENAWRQASPKLGGSAMYIEVGTQVSVENLLQGMIVQSGNDATVALAEHVAGTEATFVQMMNNFAKRLGLTGTHFTDAAGMPNPEQYITARDAALLANALIHEFPAYYKWYSQKEFTWNDITQQNRNGLLWRDPSVDGVKTGHTKSAGYCLVTSAKRGDMRLVSAVMGTDSMRAREEASAALLNYGFNFFETKRIYAAGQPLSTMRVWKGKQDEVGLTVGRDLYVTNQRGHVSSVKADFELPETLVAPLTKNKSVGKAKIVVDGQTMATYDLYPTADVPAAGFFGRAWDSLRLLFH
ncbi:MAG: D-alanyl-D-alanine carboxypeptidase [Proteobacteria bacterium]|nr:D-alanyl-D-alanine carboxypeptidase [Pseudomonadota bacterium]